MARPARTTTPTIDDPDPTSYWQVSKRPLQMLVFLLPLILFYEIALSRLLQADGRVLTNEAHKTLLQFFEVFGFNHSATLVLGGVVIVLVLLLWHLLNRDPWRVEWRCAGLMALEVAALTVPLVALSRLVSSPPAAGLATIASSGASGGGSPSMDLLSGIAISVGAGLYEELAFRMVLIAALHTLLVDLGKLPHTAGAAIAIVISAGAFTWYHPLGEAGRGVSMVRLTFYFVAGLYFGLVYWFRGFGIVVGVHAVYDIVTISTWVPVD